MATSLFTNLTNKVWYNVQNAVTDPKANAFAEKQKQIANQRKQKKEQKAKEEADAKATEEYGDPNTFSAKRIFAKVGSQTWYILKQVINPFFALMMAMIIANDMIVYSVPIRIIFFIFIFILCYTLPFITILIGIFYLLKGGYSYFVNNMSITFIVRRLALSLWGYPLLEVKRCYFVVLKNQSDEQLFRVFRSNNFPQKHILTVF
jgi:hypothetical protein